MISEKNARIGNRAVSLLAAVLVALALSSGAALAITKTCEADVECFGTSDPDTLTGTSDDDQIYGRGGPDVLKGLGGNDYLFGQGGRDRLFGGPAQDYLIGGPANDALNGGAGEDFYFFDGGWGNDSITDSATAANYMAFVQIETETLVTDDLTITLISGEGPEATTEGSTNTVNWEGNVVSHVAGGTGDDRIQGNSDGNVIFGGPGADDISGGVGDDTISVRDGSGDDIVDCGEDLGGKDDDTVHHDLSDQISANCEHKKLSQIPPKIPTT